MTTTHAYTAQTNIPELYSAPFYCFLVLAYHFNLNNIKESQIENLNYVFKNKEFFPDKKTITNLGKSPMFVTWEEKNENQTYDLRGCIGTFSKLDIQKGLKTYSLTAALQDPRFPPIIKKEVENLKCKVSILTEFKTIYDKVITDTRMHHIDPTKDNNNFWIHIEKNFNILPEDTDNTNGIEIVFSYYGKKYSATFLPEVMIEHEMDTQATFEHLLLKALSRDHKNPDDLDLLKRVIMKDPKEYIDKVIVYKSIKSSMDYDQFLDILTDLSPLYSL